jgi:hypothetical protein
MSWFQSGKVEQVPLNANRFLEMMAEVTVGWLLLDGARVAQARVAETAAEHPDQAFYEGKLQAALYYARNVLPTVADKARLLEEEDRSPLDIPEAGFASL